MAPMAPMAPWLRHWLSCLDLKEFWARGSADVITKIVPLVGDAVTEEIGSSPRITAFFLELVRLASCRGLSLAL